LVRISIFILCFL